MPFQGRSLREYTSPKPLLISTRLCGVTSRKVILFLCQHSRSTGGSLNRLSLEYNSRILYSSSLA
jgi:hypothetical protein